jgi:hypothetical protein
MMTLEKPKKRGRPAQLLQVAELHGFVEFLLEKDPRTELQNQVHCVCRPLICCSGLNVGKLHGFLL